MTGWDVNLETMYQMWERAKFSALSALAFERMHEFHECSIQAKTVLTVAAALYPNFCAKDKFYERFNRKLEEINKEL